MKANKKKIKMVSFVSFEVFDPVFDSIFDLDLTRGT